MNLKPYQASLLVCTAHNTFGLYVPCITGCVRVCVDAITASSLEGRKFLVINQLQDNKILIVTRCSAFYGQIIPVITYEKDKISIETVKLLLWTAMLPEAFIN